MKIFPINESLKTTFLFAILLLSCKALTAQVTMSCDSTVAVIKHHWPKHFEPIPADPLPYDPRIDQNFRKVFWVSGLGGNSGAWQNAGAATQDNIVAGYPAREIESEYPELSNNQAHIPVTASVLKSYINTVSNAAGQTSEEAERNIIIAASQGGIVSRYLDKIYEEGGDRKVGGIATFCSPHQGARILNNSLPDGQGWSKLQGFLDEGCSALAAGPVTESIEKNFWLDLLISDELTERIVDEFCSSLVDFAPTIVSSVNQEIAHDYKVGADIVDELNAYATPTHRVAFYAVEEPGEELWRVLHYFLNDVNDEDYFDAVHDDMGLEMADKNMMKYQAKAEAWGNLAFLFPFWVNGHVDGTVEELCTDVGLPSDCMDNINDIDEIRDIVFAWTRGYEWWLAANDLWLEVIGALEYTPEPTGEQECWCRILNTNTGAVQRDWVPYSEYSDDCSDFFDPLWPFREECELRDIMVMVGHHKDNDGLVLAESAGNWPDTKKVDMLGSNHQSMQNDPNTKERLIELFDGNHGLFFKTEKK